MEHFVSIWARQQQYLQRLSGVGVSVMVQDNVVGHVKAFPHTQVVEQGRLPKHIAHVHNCNVCTEESGRETLNRPLELT